MIISKCPLRISLAGGSTDLQEFIDEYGYGQVISFPSTLYTYITLNQRHDQFYRINYTKTETVKDPNNIKNDIAREAIKHFNLPPVTITFNSDIPATGSGLASSSSYMVALVEACHRFLGLRRSQLQVCNLAHELELKINPLTGHQDAVGCGIGDLKKIKFHSYKKEFTYIDSYVLRYNRLYLIPTNVSRQSTDILKTIDIHKSYELLQSVDKLVATANDDDLFHKWMNEAWERKKQTSEHIMTEELIQVEKQLLENPYVKSMKLCGAGGGGYFFVISDWGSAYFDNAIEIDIDTAGVQSWDV